MAITGMMSGLVGNGLGGSLALIGPIGTTEAIVILVIGLLLFGRRLPEVGRSLGKGIVEFRKGLSGIEREVENASSAPSSAPATPVSLPGGERVAQMRNPLPSEAESAGPSDQAR